MERPMARTWTTPLFLALFIVITTATSALAWDPFGIKGPLIDANTRIEQLEKEIGKTRDAMKTTIDAAILAIPGERYQRDIDKLFSANEADRKEVREKF